MEHYREKLKLQNLLLGILCCVLGAFCLLMALNGRLVSLPGSEPSGRWQSFWKGFSTGASSGVLVVAVFRLVRNLRAMGNDAALKKLYVREHDERTEKIYTCARSAAMQAFLLGGMAAVCISGYFSMTVSLSILGCVISCSLACIAMKFYYSAKI